MCDSCESRIVTVSVARWGPSTPSKGYSDSNTNATTFAATCVSAIVNNPLSQSRHFGHKVFVAVYVRD